MYINSLSHNYNDKLLFIHTVYMICLLMIIQAVWRGHSVRRRLKFAAHYAKFEDGDDFLYGEVDLDAFNFNEAALEEGWVPPDTPQMPAK